MSNRILIRELLVRETALDRGPPCLCILVAVSKAGEPACGRQDSTQGSLPSSRSQAHYRLYKMKLERRSRPAWL